MINRFGRESRLIVETEVKNGKTIFKDTFFNAPLKVAKPFYDEKHNKMKLCMMNASAGILSGDEYTIEIKVNERSKLQLYTQSYSKIFQMKDGFAVQNININIEEDGLLEYMPHPVIPFANSNFAARNTIKLKKSSRLYFRDILSCGRYKSDEMFQFNRYKSKTEVYLEDKLIFMDNTLLEPAKQQLSGIGFYEGFTHQANVFFYSENADERLKSALVKFLGTYDFIEFGATVTYPRLILVRILGKTSEKLKIITDELAEWIEGTCHLGGNC